MDAFKAVEEFKDRQHMPPPAVPGIDKNIPMLQSSLIVMDSPSGEVLRTCNDCGASFQSRAQLWNHIDSIHKMTVEDVEVKGWTKPQQ
ncbi:hypothetical protein OC834_007857, partial [Tilletia horrida]